MDDLLDSFNVSIEENNIYQPHPRFSQYKAKGKCGLQEKRRQEFLENIKNKRSEQLLAFRNLIDIEEPLKEEENEKSCPNRTERKENDKRDFRNKIMMSEWLIDVPNDFSQDWVMTFCPIGTRCLVVASKGKTWAYNRRGHLLKTFSSNFPGGNKSNHKGSTLLDCFFCPEERTLYILDVMFWNTVPMFDSETDFRIYWLISKFQENPIYDTIAKSNTFKFVLLPFYDCQPETLQKVVWDPLPFPSQNLDGLLFCHKKNHYTAGVTPLTCWLKAFMVPEILGIPIPSSLAEQVPLGYSNASTFINNSKSKPKRKVTSMDITET